MRKFLEYLGFNGNLTVTWHTKNLGVSILSGLVMFIATFTPIIAFHQVVYEEYTSNLESSRGWILLLEVAGIGLNLLGAKKVAWVLYGLSITEIIIMFASSFTLVGAINDAMQYEGAYGNNNPHVNLSWGWLAILVGPVIMGRVYLKDYLANRA